MSLPLRQLQRLVCLALQSGLRIEVQCLSFGEGNSNLRVVPRMSMKVCVIVWKQMSDIAYTSAQVHTVVEVDILQRGWVDVDKIGTNRGSGRLFAFKLSS